MKQKSETNQIKDHNVQLLLNMAAYQNHIWSFGEKNNAWTFVFLKKLQDISNVHLDFKMITGFSIKQQFYLYIIQLFFVDQS